MTTPISSSDTCAATDARSAVPDLRTWADGEPATATALNYEWRDTLNWLLGTTKPAFRGYTSTNQTLSATQPQALPITVEEVKVNGMRHATNDSKVFVPEEGWYCGTLTTGLDNGTVGNRFSQMLLVNGVQAVHNEAQYFLDWTMFAGVSFEAYLRAGSYVQLAIQGTYTSGSPRQTPIGGTYNQDCPRLEIFWSHKNN